MINHIWVYSSHHVLQTTCALVQTAFSSLSVCVSLFGYTISSAKSEMVSVLLEVLATTGFDLDWGRTAVTIGEFEVFGSIF
jgi:hypothetical protein